MREPPWKTATRSKRATAQEVRNADMTGGKRQPASGRIWHKPRDNQDEHFLVETRFTDKGSYSISGEEWGQIEARARRTGSGLSPGMQIDLAGHSLFVMSFDKRIQMEARIAELENALRELGIDPGQF